MKHLVLAIGLSASVAACDLVGPICTTEMVPALRVEVLDSISGDPLPDALVWATEGTFQDTLESGPGVAWGLYERAGTYEVHVEHEGYEAWVQDGVAVTEGECHVRTEELQARLQPSSE